MKRKFALLAVMAMALMSCNKQVFDFDMKFDKCHVYEIGKCIEIKSWTDFEDGDQIQVKTADGSTLLFHSSSIVLIRGNCPICKE